MAISRVQLTMLQVPVPCAPCIGVTKQVACLQPNGTCGSFGPVAEGYAGNCPGPNNNPAFCYEITITNCGTIPLTNVIVSDNLLGNITTNFFASPATVFQPGASATVYLTMSFPGNATNTVTVQGDAALSGTVTNGTEVITNGYSVSSSATATALVTPASISCSLALTAPNDGITVGANPLILPEILPTQPEVVVTITVQNTGPAALSGVTITPPAGFTCSPVAPFSLAVGQSQTIPLCSELVSCPWNQSFSVNVAGVVDSDASHCGVYDSTGSPISVCSGCVGTVECSPDGGCTITNDLSGTVVLGCANSTSLAGDVGLSNWTVSLYGSSANLLGTTTTDGNGNYSFSSLGGGTYSVAVTPPAGYVEFYPVGGNNTQQIVVVACQNAQANFGYANTTPPTLTQGSISSCYTSVQAATNAALAATTGIAFGGGSVTLTVATNGQYCPMVITVTGADSCGLSTNVTYSANILVSPPTMSGCAANTNVQCASEIPACPIITATNSCGTALTVVFSVVQSNPGSTCSNVITRTWSAMDCAGQSVSCTQVITQWNNVVPTLKQGSIGTCYATLSAADAAAIAATQAGTVGCSGSLTFTVTNKGTCPTAITVTGTDGCGNSVSAAYSTKILCAPPTFGTLPPATLNVQCYSAVPTMATVTAKDACGTTLTVTPSSSESNPGSSCYDVITRKWTATDCVNQTISYTETITVQNTTMPVLTKGSIGTCYASPAAAEAAAISATSGTANCGGPVNLSATCNNSYCPAMITVKGTDSCGNSATVSYTTTILIAPPTLSGVPGNTTVQCVGEIPAWPSVTATDSCRNALTVSSNSVQSNPGSTCSNVITRTWSAMDCMGQTTMASQVITQLNNVAATITCPTNVTIVTNFCQMYCTFTPGDWSGSCNGGSRYNNNWWQSWCGQNSTSQCWSSWTGWWGSCGASSSQCNNWWNNWNDNNPTSCWGSWSGNQHGFQSGNWWSSWNGGNGGNQSWVPCGGNNPDTILTSCFSKVYPKGCVTVGVAGVNCATFNSCPAVQTCLNFNGNPGTLKGCAVNPNSCGAGSFCAQVLALQLNCDFGDYGCVPGFIGKCGDLVLCDSTSPCNGKKVRDILSICNCALGSGSCPQGCTVQYLNTLCSNLNQCFEGCQVSGWCSNHLCSVYIPSPSVTGTPTVTEGCSSSITVTNIDTVTTGACSGTYVINREWIAVDGCGNTDTCTQLITIVQKCASSQICGSFNSVSPKGGYLWCNAHLTCNPNKACTIYCQGATVTLTCNDGKTYTFPVPDCQVNFAAKCTSGSCSFDGTKWTTTLPCGGDNQIFLSGCGIPWQADFANCKSVCWNGNFTCSTTGVNCQWQWSAACYNCDLSNCGSINVKPCQQTQCGYNNSDCAGTPENCKSTCQGGGCGTGGNNYCGSWSNTGSFSCN